MAYVLRSARFIAADALKQVVRPGDTVVDATLGNGHDACMLAELVGEQGHVIGFDIQPEAVMRAEAALREAGLSGRYELHALGHEHMAELVQGPVKAVVFNLGWLPGGDKRITTHWQTTQTALESALKLLLPGGICTVCAYPGHAAGDEERHELMTWLAALRPQAFNVLHHRFLNAGPGAPECFIIQRNPEENEAWNK